MILMCYAGALFGLGIQCDSHVFCARSLWSCDSVRYSSIVCVLYFCGHVFCLCSQVIQCDHFVLCLACVFSQFWNFLFR